MMSVVGEEEEEEEEPEPEEELPKKKGGKKDKAAPKKKGKSGGAGGGNAIGPDGKPNKGIVLKKSVDYIRLVTSRPSRRRRFFFFSRRSLTFLSLLPLFFSSRFSSQLPPSNHPSPISPNRRTRIRSRRSSLPDPIPSLLPIHLGRILPPLLPSRHVRSPTFLLLYLPHATTSTPTAVHHRSHHQPTHTHRLLFILPLQHASTNLLLLLLLPLRIPPIRYLPPLLHLRLTSAHPRHLHQRERWERRRNSSFDRLLPKHDVPKLDRRVRGS